MQRYTIPSDLIAQKSGYMNYTITEIAFLFNQTKQGEIVLDNITLNAD